MSVKNKPAFQSTGDSMFDLVAAVQRRAVMDAQAGDQEAIEYLNITMPDWRERLSNGRHGPAISDSMAELEGE